MLERWYGERRSTPVVVLQTFEGRASRLDATEAPQRCRRSAGSIRPNVGHGEAASPSPTATSTRFRPDALARYSARSAAQLNISDVAIGDDILSQGVTMIGDTPNVDVLTRAWNVSRAEANHEIAVFEVVDVPIPTISLVMLIASKRTGRAQDIADLAVLDAIQAPTSSDTAAPRSP
ncbi:hypothetical protein [Gemmatimonas sp.]|uniref:hypothetical protein n=1 Tax=Gemmatimonas sp. TaxID=1962908 RepID=UPI002869FD9F|nr:hypothetical protein [Gemmatimonas sp.]